MHLPDGTIRLYEHLERIEDVARLLADACILVTGLNSAGETLEDYFLGRVGGQHQG